MKSPQFPTWSPAKGMTKGGSIVSSFAGVPGSAAPTVFERSRDELGQGRGVFDRTRREDGGGAEGRVVSWEPLPVPAAPQTAEPAWVAAELPRVPAWKRVFDTTLIFLSLPVTLPLGLFISAWIQVVSPGPVFFRQARIGRGGRVFSILKFRSMKVDAPTSTHEQHLEKLIKSNAPMTKLDGVADPRIIPGGRCLRAMGLDELPQLINVLRGDMSLVGPRPSTPNEYELFTEEQRSRAAVLPGLTGYWQVSGKNKLTFQQMIDLDLQYVSKMSLGMDLAIVVATIPAMLLQFMESRTVTPQVGPMTGAPAAREPAEPPAARAA